MSIEDPVPTISPRSPIYDLPLPILIFISPFLFAARVGIFVSDRLPTLRGKNNYSGKDQRPTTERPENRANMKHHT